MPLNILIAGEHFPILSGLEVLVKSILGNDHQVDFVHNFQDVLKKINITDYDILISDIIMEGMDSFSMMEKALKRAPDLKVLIVSMNPSAIFAPRYLEAGAYGYICTTDSSDEFKKAIRQIYLGKRYIPENIQANLISDSVHYKVNDNPFAQLSKQEFAVLLLLLEGRGLKEISNMINLSISTVSTYRIRIFKKLKVNNRMELANLASHFKIIAANIDMEDK